MKVYKYYIDSLCNDNFEESTEEQFTEYQKNYGYCTRKEYEKNKLLLREKKGNRIYAYRVTSEV